MNIDLCTAILDLSTVASILTPLRVKAYGLDPLKIERRGVPIWRTRAF